jgi:hypothetical protein
MITMITIVPIPMYMASFLPSRLLAGRLISEPDLAAS